MSYLEYLILKNIRKRNPPPKYVEEIQLAPHRNSKGKLCAGLELRHRSPNGVCTSTNQPIPKDAFPYLKKRQWYNLTQLIDTYEQFNGLTTQYTMAVKPLESVQEAF